jgi:hypothetical protein
MAESRGRESPFIRRREERRREEHAAAAQPEVTDTLSDQNDRERDQNWLFEQAEKRLAALTRACHPNGL